MDTQTIESPSLPLVEISEVQARTYIEAFDAANQRPSIRTLAATWGWHRSKVERLLSRIDAETATETKPSPAEAQAIFNKHFPKPNLDQILECEAARLKQPLPEPDFVWDSQNPEIVIQAQPAVAVYGNPFGAVVIRQESDDGAEEDRFVFVHLHHVEALISRIRKVTAAIAKDTGAAS